MNDFAITAMNEVSIDKIRQLENSLLECTQEAIETKHLIHAGMYARTILIGRGVLLTGALIKRATTLVIWGDLIISTGDDLIEMRGYHVIAASKNRKQAFLAKEDTYITMLFPTNSMSVHDAEEEFTDEPDLLMSRRQDSVNIITITGE